MRSVFAVALLLVFTGTVLAQGNGDATLQVREDDGGSVVVRTANGLMNQTSSLKRRWFAINDSSSPVRLNRTGVFPRFDEKQQVPFFVTIGTASPNEAISAVEVRYLLFDIWGEHIRTLSLTRLTDSSTNVDLRDTGWLAFDSEAAQLVTVVAFVARVRTADGQVWTFDHARMLAQVQSLGLTVTGPDLLPDERRPINPGALYWTYYPGPNRSTANTVGDTRP